MKKLHPFFYVLLCCSFLSFNLAKSQSVLEILGDTNVCVNTTAHYVAKDSIPRAAYSWSLTSLGSLTSLSGYSTNVYWSVVGTATLSFVVTDSIGDTIGVASLNVHVRPLPKPYLTANQMVGCQTLSPLEGHNLFEDGECMKACAGSRVTYTAHGSTGSTYSWVVSGGTIYSTHDSVCVVNWSTTPGQGSVIVTETSAYGCKGSKTLCIEIIPKPNAAFTLSDFIMELQQACLDQDIFFFDHSTSSPSPLVNWYWDFGDGNTFGSSTTTNPVHAYHTPGDYTIMLVVKNACNCTDTAWFSLHVNDNHSVQIECASLVCEGASATYSLVPPLECDESSYVWEVQGGSYSPNGTSVDVVWDNVDDDGFGLVNVHVNCDPCPGVVTIKIPVLKDTVPIRGQAVVCDSGTYLYRVPAWPGTTFSWSISTSTGAFYSPTDQPNEIVVHTNGAGIVTLHCDYHSNLVNCGGVADIDITVMTRATISGLIKACQNDSIDYELLTGYMGHWQWSIRKPNGDTLIGFDDQNIINTGMLSLPGIYTISIITADFCPPKPIILTILATPPMPDTVIGALIVCRGIPYTYQAGNSLAGAFFAWSATNVTLNGFSDTTANGREITAIFQPGIFSLRVRRVLAEAPHCKSEARIVPVVPEQVNVHITGDSTVCADSHESYSAGYTRGETYEWKIIDPTSGSITGNGTPNVIVTWNHQTTATTAQIIVLVRRCIVIYSDTLTVTINAIPNITLTMDTVVCRGHALTLTTNATGVDSIVWNFGNGQSQTSTTAATTYTYPLVATTSDVGYTVTATITSHDFCNNPVIVTGHVSVRPSPYVYITPGPFFGHCIGSTISDTMTATLQSDYEPTSTLTWYTPSGSSSCSGPPFSCTTIIGTTGGNYNVVATGANGCTTTSNTIGITTTNCDPSSTCTPTPTPSASFIATGHCGHISITATHNRANPSWQAFPGATNVTITNGSSTSSTITADFTEAGEYSFVFARKYASAANNNDTCPPIGTTLGVVVPLIADLVYKADSCAASGYVLKIYDHSTYYPGANMTQYSFYVDGVLKQSTATSFYTTAVLTPGAHVFKEVVHFSFNDGITTYSDSCEVTKNITLPDLPMANYTFVMNNTCTGVPIIFTNSSTGFITSFWNFGDGSFNTLNDVEKVFEYPTSSPHTRDVTLTVTNSLGCKDTITKTISIQPNRLTNNVAINPVNATFCEGSSQVLSIITTGFANPNQYTWYNDTIFLFTTPISTFNVTQNGYYYVTASDQYKCNYTTDAVPIAVLKVPDPEIIGKHDQCHNTAFTLNGYLGDELTYEWSVTDSTGANPTIISSDPQIEQILPFSTQPYIYTLTISATNGCSKTQQFEVTVHHAPADPSITFSITDCDYYTVQLHATSSTPGLYNWSHGAVGATAYSNIGGFYKVWLTDRNGCISSSEVNVPKDPAGYLWVFPTGCYKVCIPTDGIVINGPIEPFTAWQYNFNSYPYLSGTGNVSPLTIASAGSYSLMLANDYCSDSIGYLNISLIDVDCANNLDCFEVKDVTPQDESDCGITLPIHIDNPGTYPVAFTMFSSLPGTFSPPGGVITPGANDFSVSWTAAPGTHGTVVFTIRFWFADHWCDVVIYSYDFDCPGGNRFSPLVLGKTTLNVQQTEKSALYPTILQLAPNPAHTGTKVSYAITPKSSRQLNLHVYDMLGRQVYTTQLSGSIGNADINTANWLSGAYNVILRADGKITKTTKLSVQNK